MVPVQPLAIFDPMWLELANVLKAPNILLLLASGALFVWVLVHQFTIRTSAKTPMVERLGNDEFLTPSISTGEEAFGEWSPKKFKYPTIKPCHTPLSEIKPIPYRPFRWGAYHITMGIRSMPWDDWIELDNQYFRYLRIRHHRIRTRGEGVIRMLDDAYHPQLVKGGEVAAIELVHELAEYLSRRYPTTFRVTRHADAGEYHRISQNEDSTLTALSPSAFDSHCNWGWDGASSIKNITVIPLDATYELPLHVKDGDRAPQRAMEIAALLVQDDLAVMIEGRDGKYYFQAGAICVSGFWRMQDKIGLPLDEIHVSGDVPRYREKLQPSMERFFRKLAVDKPVARNNYFIQVIPEQRKGPAQTVHPDDLAEEDISVLDPEELAWSTSANGPEDGFTLAHAFDAAAHLKRPIPTPETLRLRTERQTLRRLKISGAVVFTIRTYLIPITELAEEEGVPARMASALRSWPEDVKEYKGVYRGGWWTPLLNYLDDKAESS